MQNVYILTLKDETGKVHTERIAWNQLAAEIKELEASGAETLISIVLIS